MLLCNCFALVHFLLSGHFTTFSLLNILIPHLSSPKQKLVSLKNFFFLSHMRVFFFFFKARKLIYLEFVETSTRSHKSKKYWNCVPQMSCFSNCSWEILGVSFKWQRRRWHPTLVLLPGESQGQGSLVGFCLWGRTESDMTEAT